MFTRRLATFATGVQYDQLPPEAVHHVKRCLIDYIGVCVGGSDQPAARILGEVLDAGGDIPQATVIASERRRSLLDAALLNGLMSHVLDFDDTHLPTILHPTGPTMSAALPLAEDRQASGPDLIAAFVGGFEVACRIALAVHPAHYDAGWHITGTVGGFGAAAASGRLLRLDEAKMAHALGIAASRASGFREMFGTMTKSLHSGSAAAAGLLASLLAERGFTSSPEAIEGRRGFARTASSIQNFDEALDGLGERFEHRNHALKPYPCGVVTHPSIDAARRLRQRGARADQVVSATARVHPLALELTGKQEPRTGLEGKFSLYHCIAVGLLEGKAGTGQFTDEAVNNPRAVDLRRKVTAVAEPGLREGEAHLRLELADGASLDEYVPAASGTPEAPLSDDQLEAKFNDLVWPYFPRWKADRILGLCWELEKLADMRELVRLLA